MALLYFSDVLRRAGIEPAKVKLIRHSLADKGFRSCYQKGMVTEYTCWQKEGFSREYPYWAVFISEKDNHARLYALYKVGNSVPDTASVVPAGFPHPEWFKGEKRYFSLERLDVLQEYEGRLVIDWGEAPRMWHQMGTTEKPIVAIQSAMQVPFPGYENVVLTYDQLKEMVENGTDYVLWHTALAAVNAVYLIVDTENGRQYVGSAYGAGGLLGRWRCYVDTLHGNNKLMRELICLHPDRYHHFQFSILQILPQTATADEMIRTESLWKQKLRTIQFGMNGN